MPAIDSVYNDLINIRNTFRKLIISTNYVKVDNTSISWKNYKSGIDSSILYAKNYEYLKENEQYSFMLRDGSFIQIYYKFTDSNIYKARLAYYPYPIKTRESVEDLYEYYMEADDDMVEQLYGELISEAEGGAEFHGVNTSHIRIDFDASAESHAKCHLQIGSINKIRISSRVLMSPFLFCELVFRNCFADEFNRSINMRKLKTLFKFSKKKNIHIDSTFNEDNIFLNLE